MDINCALIAMARNEDRFIDEWVNYHLNLGFNHIYICDNNDIDNPLVIDNDKVTIYAYNNIDFSKESYAEYRDERDIQYRIYSEVLSKIDDKYDYCAICDIDEFFYFNGKSLKSFIKSNMIDDNSTVISLFWLTYTDNNLIEEVDKPILETYNQVNISFNSDMVDCNNFNSVKSIFKLNKGIKSNAHLPDEKTMDCFTHKVLNRMDGVVKHYRTKCLESYLNKRVLDKKYGNYLKNFIFEYFQINTISEEKLNYLNNWLKKNNIQLTEQDERLLRDLNSYIPQSNNYK